MPSDDEVIERGLHAEALLTSPIFKAAIDYVADGYANAILLSAPHEKQRREEHYHLHRAINDVVSQLGSWVSAKDEVVERLKQKEILDNE